MKKQDRDPILFLEDIKISISRILEYTKDMDEHVFFKNDRAKDAVFRNFEIISEAVRNVPKSLKEKYVEIHWDKLRNIVSHEYFSIDYKDIWNILKNYLPENKKQIEYILQMECKS